MALLATIPHIMAYIQYFVLYLVRYFMLSQITAMWLNYGCCRNHLSEFLDLCVSILFQLKCYINIVVFVSIQFAAPF